MAIPIPIDQLGQIAIFQCLSPSVLASLAEDLRMSTYPAQTYLITVGQTGDRVYIILRGTVKVLTDHADGSEITLALQRPGEVVGEMRLVDNLVRSASVVTLEPSLVASMNRGLFWRRLSGTSGLMSNMIVMLSRRLRLADLRIQAYATLGVEGRIPAASAAGPGVG
jgi:CRP/FNR family transcriptional regulator, cyclic AMP receptor protein